MDLNHCIRALRTLALTSWLRRLFYRLFIFDLECSFWKETDQYPGTQTFDHHGVQYRPILLCLCLTSALMYWDEHGGS